MNPKPWKLERQRYMTEAEVERLFLVLEKNRNAELAGRGVKVSGQRRSRRGWWIRMHAAILLAARAGLRVNEIATLRAGHLELDGTTPAVYVHGGKAKICKCAECAAERKRLGVKLKPEEKRKLDNPRPVYLNTETVGELREFLDFKKDSGEDTSPAAYLFPARQGRRAQGHIAKLSLQAGFKKVLAAAGLPTRYGPHALRHYFGLYTQQKHGDLRNTQLQLRHASSTTTETYTAYTAEKRSELANGVFKESERPAWIDQTFENPEQVDAAMRAAAEKTSGREIEKILQAAEAAGATTPAELLNFLKQHIKPTKPKRERKTPPKPTKPTKPERRTGQDRRFFWDPAAHPKKGERRTGRERRTGPQLQFIKTRAEYIAKCISEGIPKKRAEELANERFPKNNKSGG